jgi:hypothetical protein
LLIIQTPQFRPKNFLALNNSTKVLAVYNWYKYHAYTHLKKIFCTLFGKNDASIAENARLLNRCYRESASVSILPILDR